MASSMFEVFERLRDAVENNTVAEEWAAVLRDRISVPWDGRRLNGHIPVLDFWNAEPALREPLGTPGLYAFVSWTGDATQEQYIGIASRYSLGDRARGRYFGSPNEGARAWTEIRFASAHRDRLVLLPDHYSPRRTIQPEIFTAGDVPLPRSRSHWRRVVRAQRYASNDLARTSFYPIPAPPDTPKKSLERIEREVIKAANARLYKMSRTCRTAPLLNVVHAKSRLNPYVSAPDLPGYNAWIDGSWWSQASR